MLGPLTSNKQTTKKLNICSRTYICQKKKQKNENKFSFFGAAFSCVCCFFFQHKLYGSFY